MTFSFKKTRKKISANFLTVGLNLSNNGSICIMRGDKIELYLESERITRRKRDWRIKSLLDYIDGTPDVIAFADAYWDKPDKELQSASDIAAVKKRFPTSKIRDYRNSHHLTHAALAWHDSGFEDAICIVVDANGSKKDVGIEIETVYDFPSCIPLYKKYFSQEDIGIGKKFEQACLSYGFDQQDAGKIMGLSAYGKGEAFQVQKEWENRACELVNRYSSRNIILVGGCFLNCVVNYKLLKKFGKKIYVEPIAHDGGTAIGAAYLAHML